MRLQGHTGTNRIFNGMAQGSLAVNPSIKGAEELCREYCMGKLSAAAVNRAGFFRRRFILRSGLLRYFCQIGRTYLDMRDYRLFWAGSNATAAM